MCAAVTCPPLRELQHYNPSFKVEVCLHLPLWPGDDAVYDVISLCSELDLLCARELSQAQKEKRPASKLSESFSDKAQIVAEQLRSLSSRLPGGDLSHYLVTSGIEKLYPKAAKYLSQPNMLPSQANWSPMEDHIEALSALHRLQGLANQIHQDMRSLSNHKYIAHQLALLHQSLAAVSQVSYMSDLKKNIETNFPAIKESIGNLQDRGQTPCLSEQHKQWLEELTDQIILVCRNPPSEIQECLHPATQVLQQASRIS